VLRTTLTRLLSGWRKLGQQLTVC